MRNNVESRTSVADIDKIGVKSRTTRRRRREGGESVKTLVVDVSRTRRAGILLDLKGGRRTILAHFPTLWACATLSPAWLRGAELGV